MLSDLNVSSYVHPYIYPMFLIMLPFNTPKGVLLSLAFLVGLTIDTFTNTGGMHAASSVFIAFTRPWFIKIFTPVTGYEGISAPSVAQLSFVWYLLFTLTLIFVHHAIYFCIQIFWMKDPLFVLLKIIMSTAVSTLLIILLTYLFASKRIKH